MPLPERWQYGNTHLSKIYRRNVAGIVLNVIYQERLLSAQMPIVSQFKSLHACLAQRTATWLLLVQIGHARMMYSTSFLNRDPLKNTPSQPSQGEYTDFMDSYILHVSASCFSDPEPSPPCHHPKGRSHSRRGSPSPSLSAKLANSPPVTDLSLRPWRLCCSTHRHLCRTWNMVELSSGESAALWHKIWQH